MKTIKIGEKDYKMQSSAYTQFAYRNETGRGMIKDLQELIAIKAKEDFDNLEVLDNISELVLRLAYVMIKEADETQVTDYESFLKSISNIYGDLKWVEEVITLASTPLLGRLQADKE